jgi:hypothetical protein
MSTATGVGTEDVESETNPNAVITIFDAPGTPSTTLQFCSSSGAASGETCSASSGPLYAVEYNAPPNDNWQICVGGHEPAGGFFEACNSVAVSVGTSPASSFTVALAGQIGPAPNTVAITLTLTNTGSSAISGLGFTDPTGLENDGVLITKGKIVAAKSGLTLTSGPSPALPSTLPAGGSPVVVTYTYTSTSSADAVLVAKATGTDSIGNTLTGKAALTVLVTSPPVSEADYQKLVTSALLADDSVTSEALNTIANTEANSLATGLHLSAASPGQQYAAVQLGLPTQMGVMVGTPNNSAFRQWFGNYFTTLASDLKGDATSLGQAGEALATQLLQNITDPEARAAALGRLVDGILALPAKTKGALASQADNLGYLGQALAAAHDGSGVLTAASAGASELASLQSDVTYAASGFSTMVAADNAAYAKNPTAFINAESKQYADATNDLFKTEVAAVLGDGIAKGVVGAAKAGFTALKSSAPAIDSTVAAAVESSAPAPSGSTEALMQNSTVATSQFQTLPAGTVLSASDAAQIGGMVPGDQVGVQKSLNYIFNKFGVQLELGVRTSEPLSVGIDGSPKLSFMKPKAVSSMDMTMGAPSEIAAYTVPGQPSNTQVFSGGVTTVFKPVPIPQATLDAIGESNPKYVTEYKDRFGSQMKLWDEYQDPSSSLRILVSGSEKSLNGVTAIADVPGFRLPSPPAGAPPLVYLQQLDQEAFQAQWGLTSDQAQALKTSLSKSPGAVQVDYIARPNPDGSISFFDGLNDYKPIVSDFDLEFYQPLNGAPWPPGQKSTIQQEFMNQLQQNVSRLPDHGASGTVFDLPADKITVANGFVMKTADPAFAQAVADNLAAQYASQSAIFSGNAARLTAQAAVTSDPAEVKALLAQAQSYRATANTFAKVDAAYLLAKYPPGEKIIVIKLGDVRVGYGPSPS